MRRRSKIMIVWSVLALAPKLACGCAGGGARFRRGPLLPTATPPPGNVNVPFADDPPSKARASPQSI